MILHARTNVQFIGYRTDYYWLSQKTECSWEGRLLLCVVLPELVVSFSDYSRTETAFAVIALLLMLIGHVFVFYSLREPRYMFKRLTALMHFMTGKLLFSILVSRQFKIPNMPRIHDSISKWDLIEYEDTVKTWAYTEISYI